MFKGGSVVQQVAEVPQNTRLQSRDEIFVHLLSKSGQFSPWKFKSFSYTSLFTCVVCPNVYLNHANKLYITYYIMYNS